MKTVRSLSRRLWHLLPERVRDWIQFCPPVAALRTWLCQRRWRHASHDEIYDAAYFQFVEQSTRSSADTIADSIVGAFRPGAVVDVGCGTGALLDALRVRGVKVQGLEYARAALEFCRDRQLDVRPFDLRNEQSPDLGPVDLAVSMEVGNQLPESAADRYVELLCRLAGIVVFSSEVPGGGDKCPLNERPHAYWIAKFGKRGYCFEEAMSQQWRTAWRQRGVAPWFCRNLMIFCRHATPDGVPQAASTAVARA